MGFKRSVQNFQNVSQTCLDICDTRWSNEMRKYGDTPKRHTKSTVFPPIRQFLGPLGPNTSQRFQQPRETAFLRSHTRPAISALRAGGLSPTSFQLAGSRLPGITRAQAVTGCAGPRLSVSPPSVSLTLNPPSPSPSLSGSHTL